MVLNQILPIEKVLKLFFVSPSKKQKMTTRAKYLLGGYKRLQMEE